MPTGDYNQNGVIDAANHVARHRGSGMTCSQPNDEVWLAYFGQTIRSGVGPAR
jgi:hypothetical protein